MECSEAREHLADLDRGRLAPDLADSVRAHAAGCAACGRALRVEGALHTLIREQAPRYAAPTALRARIQASLRTAERPVSVGWLRLHPWVAGGAVGAVAAVIAVWVAVAWLGRDPVSQLVARAVDEHAEYAREAMHRAVPDAAELLARVRAQVSFSLGPLFPGDAAAPLIATTAGELRGKPAVALVYRNGPERYTTLLLMPGRDATIPAEDRLAIETFKPHHRVVSGKQVLYWKQRDLACLMVSDLDQSGTAAMFLKIRKAA
jgi:anti-sigma factor (TIGR02949 family)